MAASAAPEIVLLTDERLIAAPPGNAYNAQVHHEERFLAGAFERLGFTVARVAWSDPAFDWTRPRAALFRSTWDYFERPAECAAWLDRVAPITRLFNEPALVRWNFDKRYLLELATRGVAIVPTERIERGAALELARRVAAGPREGLVVKPAVSGAARETWRVDAANLAQRAPHLDALLRQEALLVQPFEPAIATRGEFSFIVIAGRCRHAVRKVPKRGDFRVQDDHGGTVQPHEPSHAEVTFAEHAAAAAPYPPLYARVDAVESAAGLRLMELEVIEPELFFRFRPQTAEELAAACAGRATGGHSKS